jgi:hypothetical protein
VSRGPVVPQVHVAAAASSSKTTTTMHEHEHEHEPDAAIEEESAYHNNTLHLQLHDAVELLLGHIGRTNPGLKGPTSGVNPGEAGETSWMVHSLLTKIEAMRVS